MKGLLGRKLRAALTATAIVLGVAMASGTFVLTDTINGALQRDLLAVVQERRRRHHRQDRVRESNGNGVQAPSFPETLLAKVQALPDVAAAAGAVTDDATKLVGHDGKAIGSGGAPNLGFSVDPNDQRFNPLQARLGNVAARQRPDRDRRGTAELGALRGRRHDRRREQGPGRGFRDRGDRQASAASLDRRRDDGHVRSPDGAGLFTSDGQLD